MVRNVSVGYGGRARLRRRSTASCAGVPPGGRRSANASIVTKNTKAGTRSAHHQQRLSLKKDNNNDGGDNDKMTGLDEKLKSDGTPESNEFKVQVRNGSLSRPVYKKRSAIMSFSNEQKDISFSYSNCCTVVKAESICKVPWTPPRGNTLRFMFNDRPDEEMIIEFETHDVMIKAFNKLKSNYLKPSQFTHTDEMRVSRGLHTTVPQTSAGNEKSSASSSQLRSSSASKPGMELGLQLPDREQCVKNLIEMFEQLGLPPLSPDKKRLKESSSGSTTLYSLAKQPQADSSSESEFIKPPHLREPKKPFKLQKTEKGETTGFFAQYTDCGSSTARNLLQARPENVVIIPSTSASTSNTYSAGFANLGNTCYMNSMLQGLLGVDLFTKDLFKFCKIVQNRNIDLVSTMAMSWALSNLASRHRTASPELKRELLKAVKHASRFKGNAQQDANEFLVRVLNQVHDECERVLREQLQIEESLERREQNPVMANFAFTIESSIICDECHHVSRTEEDSIILPVTINVLDHANKRVSKRSFQLPSIQTLLDQYLETEKVERTCEKCTGKSAQRIQKFVRLPRCLIVFIKRYAYHLLGSVKRQDKIEIPLYVTLHGHCISHVNVFPAVSRNTKEIDFVTASPLKSINCNTRAIITPSPAKRRLDFSNTETDVDLNQPTTSASSSIEASGDLYQPVTTAYIIARMGANQAKSTVSETGPDVVSNSRSLDSVTLLNGCNGVISKGAAAGDGRNIRDKKAGVTVSVSTDENAVSCSVTGSAASVSDTNTNKFSVGIDPIIEDFTFQKKMSPSKFDEMQNSITEEELSYMSEEQQMQLAFARSLAQTTSSVTDCTKSSAWPTETFDDADMPDLEEAPETPRQRTSVDSATFIFPITESDEEGSHGDVEMSERTEAIQPEDSESGKDEEQQKEGEEIEGEDGDQQDEVVDGKQVGDKGDGENEMGSNEKSQEVESSGIESTCGAEGSVSDQSVIMKNNQNIQDTKKSFQKSDDMSKESGDGEKEKVPKNCAAAEKATEPKSDLPLVSLGGEPMEISDDEEEQKKDEDSEKEKKCAARPSAPIERVTLDPELLDLSPVSSKSLETIDSTQNSDLNEIVSESASQLPIPYKPLPVMRRKAICEQIGLIFISDNILETNVCVMGVNDRPSDDADITGDGNCLFRALAFYFAGSDAEHMKVRKTIVEFEMEHWREFAILNKWSSVEWNNHMNHLLSDSTWGTEIELFAVASMLNVDVWTFLYDKWLCYRPRFRVKDGEIIRIPFSEYSPGVNDGIYLLNEENHYTPVLKPSNAFLQAEGTDVRANCLALNANSGFMKPSYRLISVISHIGQSSDSGHYVCDVWSKERGWLHCNDETIEEISGAKIHTRNEVGYIYFYINSPFAKKKGRIFVTAN